MNMHSIHRSLRVISRALSLGVVTLVALVCSASAQSNVMTVRNTTTGLVLRTTDGGSTWGRVSAEDTQHPRRIEQLVEGEAVSMASAAPNPTSGVTTIRYRLDEPGEVTVAVNDIRGMEVARFDRETGSAGDQSLMLDGSGFPNGTYYYQISLDGKAHGSGVLVIAR
jgi:hypothetical protein